MPASPKTPMRAESAKPESVQPKSVQAESIRIETERSGHMDGVKRALSQTVNAIPAHLPGTAQRENTKHSPSEWASIDLAARKTSYEYNLSNTLGVLLSYKGTFWQYVFQSHELYVFPVLHLGLILYQWDYSRGQEVEVGDGEEIDTEVHAGDSDTDAADANFWGVSEHMLPWAALGVLTPLMIFALVTFMSQCYSRFMTFFYCCQLMETAVQDLAVLMLVHASSHADRWDAVRFLTAAAMSLYMCVTDLAKIDEKTGRRCKMKMDLDDYARFLEEEREWHSDQHKHMLDTERWEEMLGWARPRSEERAFTDELHARFGTSTELPQRRQSCPPLLTVWEVNLLREYPDEMMTLVLLTWCAQTLKILEAKGELKGPNLGQAHATILKLRGGSKRIRNLLRLPVPLPYFHTLAMMQNICFALYSYSLLDLHSFLTPVVLMLVVLVTVGLREVAVALSNPFGRDDVDFPVDTWIVQLRGIALMVHPDNQVCARPPADTGPLRNEDQEDEEVDYDDVGDDGDEPGGGDGDGDDGDGGGGDGGYS